jgi:hypothetical protein
LFGSEPFHRIQDACRVPSKDNVTDWLGVMV